jgi:chromosome segregation ATPase
MKQVHDHDDALKAAEHYFSKLEDEIAELSSEVESLQHQLDGAEDYINDLESQNEELREELR